LSSSLLRWGGENDAHENAGHEIKEQEIAEHESAG